MAEISESEIGKRVTVRLRDGAGFRDLVGHLESRTSLRNRQGQLLHFDPEQIHIWKVIEEVPKTATSGAPLSLRIYELERIVAATWLPKESEIIDGWLFRADIGITKRANSALALNSDKSEVQIDELVKWYRHRNLTPTINLMPEIQSDLDERLAARGFKIYLDVKVMVKDYQIESSNEDLSLLDYTVTDTPEDEWMALQGDEKLKPIMLRSPAKYISIFDPNNPRNLVGVGRVGLQEDWAVLSRIFVSPEFRGRGYGRQILNALEVAANQPKLALQVASNNQIAISMYESAGYQTHHHFRIRELYPQIDLAQDCC